MDSNFMAIEQVLYRCCHAVDQGDIEKIVNVFHPDATLIINWEENGKYSGHGEIRQWFLDYIQVMKASMRYLRHKITSPMIEINGDDATVFSYLDVEAAQKDVPQVIITVCRYEDKLCKVNEHWYLKEKSIFMDDTYIIKK